MIVLFLLEMQAVQCQLPRPFEQLLVASDVLVRVPVGHEDVFSFVILYFLLLRCCLLCLGDFGCNLVMIEGAGFFSLKCVSKGSVAMWADDIGTDKPLGSCVVPVTVATVVRVPAVHLVYTA